MPSLDERVAAVEARQAISDVLWRYAAGLDSQDWALWRGVFAERVIFDMRNLYPGWRNAPRDRRKASDADRNVRSIARQVQ